MSSNRLNYDVKAYEKKINESTGPGKYQLSRPAVACEPCFQTNPEVRAQSVGVSISKDRPLIDVDSELMGLTRKASKDPVKKQINNEDDNNLKHFQDCFLNQESTRLSNPANNLKGTGWNRWEWLCQNPQDKVEIPFNWNINERLVAKDNHKPCIPTLIDHTNLIPKLDTKLNKDEVIKPTYAVPTSSDRE